MDATLCESSENSDGVGKRSSDSEMDACDNESISNASSSVLLS